MLSKRACQKIAADWQSRHGLAESQRRLAEVYTNSRISEEKKSQLEDGIFRFMLAGGYDPPLPEIPGFLSRLLMTTWTPPPVDWPMNTEKRDT